MSNYSTGWVGFQNSTRRGGTDFFPHRGSAFYSVEPPTGADFLPTATPPRSLRETAQITCLKTRWVKRYC